ncbi:MAG: protein kinase [Acidobacteriota bacterium]
MAGTLPYMAPELFENQPPDPRSDLFSLGVLFYEMATGRCPFQRQTSQATVAAVLTDQPPPPEELNPDLVHGLGRVIQRLLEKDPEKRYADCSAVRADLQQVVAPGATVERRAWAGVTARWFLLIPLLLLAMFLWNYLRPEPATIQSIAVLPFENLSGDPDQEYLADAMTDALIASLALASALYQRLVSTEPREAGPSGFSER